jgi:hypothetical protein
VRKTALASSTYRANGGTTKLDRGAAGDAQRRKRQPGTPAPDKEPEIIRETEGLYTISQDMLTCILVFDGRQRGCSSK